MDNTVNRSIAETIMGLRVQLDERDEEIKRLRENSMRKLIEREVIFEYKCRNKDIQLSHITYLREKANLPPLTGLASKGNDNYRWLEVKDGDIESFIKQLSDEELFIAIDGQLCEKYR